MRRETLAKIILVVLLLVLVPLLQRAHVEYRRSQALASLSQAGSNHDCCEHAEESMVKLDELLKRDPAWIEARLMLAEEYGNANDKRNEEKHYRLAVKYASRDPRTHLKLGEFLMFDKRYKEAAKVFDRCISLDGGSVEARENLARCLERSGRSDSALEVWSEVLSRDPDNTSAELAVKRLTRSSKKQPQLVK